jgi:hypothetical protein
MSQENVEAVRGLLAHWATRFALLRSRRRDDELLFGGASGSPFWPHRVTRRADEAWGTAGLLDAYLGGAAAG